MRKFAEPCHSAQLVNARSGEPRLQAISFASKLSVICFTITVYAFLLSLLPLNLSRIVALRSSLFLHHSTFIAMYAISRELLLASRDVG